MAKETTENDELIVDVQEVYSKTETFIDGNKNIIVGIVIGMVVLIGGYFAFNNFILGPQEVEAQKEMFMAEKYFALDSMALAIDGNNEFAGFIEIADKYGSTKSGNLANYYLGIAFLRNGEFQSAIEALDKFNGDDEMLATEAIGAQGDAYLELENMDKAASHYLKAANRSENAFTSPYYLMKAGRTYELMGENGKALAAYESIKEDYKTSSEATEIEKFIARAESAS